MVAELKAAMVGALVARALVAGKMVPEVVAKLVEVVKRVVVVVATGLAAAVMVLEEVAMVRAEAVRGEVAVKAKETLVAAVAAVRREERRWHMRRGRGRRPMAEAGDRETRSRAKGRS